MTFEHIAVVGAGAWGTALAITMARAGRKVLLAARQAYPTRSYPNLGLLPALRREATSAPENQLPEGLAIGNPDRITEVLKNWESVGVDRINFLLNAAETVPQAEVLASMRLFAKEVMPKFADKKQPVAAGTAAGGS